MNATTKYKAVMDALAMQRNQALDAVAGLHGEIAERDELIVELRQRIVDLETPK